MEVNDEDVKAKSCKCQPWSLRQRSWFYRGEGNASVVIAVPKEKIIVRLVKIDTKLRRMDSDYQFASSTNVTGIRTVEETLERLEFGRRLLAPLLGYGLVSPLKVVHIDTEEIEEIESRLETVRPAHRLHKRLAPVCHAIVGLDCTLLPFETCSEEPVFCVELKPKQGFLSAGRDKCPFCLKQFLKQQLGKINVLSEYCPLDLFSGSWHRMTQAILALTQTPQNNLRIFKNGKLVFGEDCPVTLNRVLEDWFSPHCGKDSDSSPPLSSPLHSICYLIIRALLSKTGGDCIGQKGSSFTTNGFHHCKASATSAQFINSLNETLPQKKRDHSQPCTLPEGTLPESCVLQRLLRVQELGDVDFNQLYDSYDHLADRMREGVYSYQNLRWTNPEVTAAWLKEEVTEDDNSDDRAARLVQRYRIYSTARDCSIMLAFQRISETLALVQDRPLLRDLNGKLFTYHISIVDIDPKPVTCVDKHRRRDRAMSDAFRASASSRRR